MPQETKNYNLLEEEWIPILRTNGQFERLGIRKALTEAGNIRQIAARSLSHNASHSPRGAI